ncbi:hypothetical protein pdam_00025054 [Pocillopora damicornis]|uniref:Uncharacterized protein n=1 Tax=Pocillopora damicornis TaxID=46731 RepID=A0A3M6UIH3_POCDA|nr:hypothetical protein pdam_00025054 [Pocillopora damicornis]
MTKSIFSVHEKHQANRLSSIQEAIGLFSDTLRVIVNTFRISASALCGTRNNNGNSWNSPFPGEPVSLERSDFEEQQENSRKQGEKQDGILSYDSLCDDGDMVTFHLWNEGLIFTWEDENQLRKKYSLQLQCNGCHAFATGH